MNIHGSIFADFISLGLTPAGIDEAEALILLSTQDPKQANLIKWLFQRIRGSCSDSKPDVVLSPADDFYLDALLSLMDQTTSSNDVLSSTRIHKISSRMDFLYYTRNENIWSPVKLVNFFYRSNVTPSKSAAVVTCVRNEAINVVEWIAHHRVLGFDDFFFYINDSDDKTFELLAALARNGICHLITNETSLGKRKGEDYFPIQSKALEHAIHVLSPLRRFEWVLFSDVDEFLVTKVIASNAMSERPLDDLVQRLNNLPYRTSGVLFNWKWFGSNSIYSRETGLNFERFSNFVESGHVKTLARFSRCLSFPTSHLPNFPHGDRILDGGLCPVHTWDHTMPVVYDYGQINHYWNKSFEEFIAKLERGWGYRSLDDFFTWGNNLTYGQFECLPRQWLARVKEELALLQSLSGVKFWLDEAESSFRQSIERYTAERNLPALYLSGRFPPIKQPSPKAAEYFSGKIGVFRHVVAPSQSVMRRPLLPGTEHFAAPWLCYWHTQVDQTPSDDLACYSLMGAILSQDGTLWQDKEPFAPADLDRQGTSSANLGDHLPLRNVFSPCIVLTNFGGDHNMDKALDWLLRVGIARHATNSLNLPLRILLDRAAPDWIRDLLRDVWSIGEHDIETYDADTERMFLWHALVPTSPFGHGKSHPFLNRLIDEIFARRSSPASAPKHGRVFLTQQSSILQPKRRCINESEIMNLAEQYYGFIPVSVENLGWRARIEVFSQAEIVINNTDQDMTTAILCSPDTRFANLSFRTLLSSEIGTFRGFQSAYFMLGTESVSEYSVVPESFSSFLSVLCS